MESTVIIAYTEHLIAVRVPENTVLNELVHSDAIRLAREEMLKSAGIPDILCESTPKLLPAVDMHLTVKQWEHTSF